MLVRVTVMRSATAAIAQEVSVPPLRSAASCQRGITMLSSREGAPAPTRPIQSVLLNLGKGPQGLAMTRPRRQMHGASAMVGGAERRRVNVGRWEEDKASRLSRQQRWLSSHTWGNIDSTTQKANADAAKLPAAVVHKAGEAEIDRVEKAMRGMAPQNENFTVRRDGLEVFVDMGAGVGTYWVQYDRSLRQICLMSPRSGAYRYHLDGSTGRWISEADRHDFEGMLTRDIIQQAYGIPDFDAK